MAQGERWIQCQKCFLWAMFCVEIPRSKWAVPAVCFFKPVLDDDFSQNLVRMTRNDPVIGNLLQPLPLTT